MLIINKQKDYREIIEIKGETAMARPIAATPVLKGDAAAKFLDKIKLADEGKIKTKLVPTPKLTGVEKKIADYAAKQQKK